MIKCGAVAGTGPQGARATVFLLGRRVANRSMQAVSGETGRGEQRFQSHNAPSNWKFRLLCLYYHVTGIT